MDRGSRSQLIKCGDCRLDLYIKWQVDVEEKYFGVENEFDSDIKEIDFVCS